MMRCLVPIRFLMALVVGTSCCAVAFGADSRSFVIVAKRAYTACSEQPGYLADAVIVVRDGRIVAVGSGLDLPPDLPVVRFRDATVIPGLIDAANHLAGEHAGDETAAAGYRAIDTYDAYADRSLLLAGGVTTVHLNPGAHRLISGQGAVVKLGGPLGERVINDRADLTVNLGARAFGPPLDVTFSFPASSDVAIEPGVRQRPNSRLGQILELEQRLSAADVPADAVGPFDFHRAALRRSSAPLRIQVRRAADIEQALAFAKAYGRSAYLVGIEEGALTAHDLRDAGLPVVLQTDAVFGQRVGDIGPDPDAFDPYNQPLLSGRSAFEMSDGLTFALAGSFDSSTQDLRLAAATAMRAGLSESTALDAITRVPAEILGVADRVGSIEPGKDADLVILAGDPLDAAVNVLRVYVGGSVAFRAPETNALVVKAGTIWTGHDAPIVSGAVLIEDGKITAVGPTVPRPRFAQVVDAGPDAFVTPGFIDAHGHLGLEGDRRSVDSDLPIADLVGYAGRQFTRVARAGVTTVLLSPYQVGARGGRMAAIKTAGDSRDVLVARGLAAVKFKFREADPLLGLKSIKSALEAGKKYVEKWDKYEKELREWEEAKKAGKTPVEQKDEVEEVIEEEKPDPITGTWALTLSGDPLPESVEAEMILRLEGDAIEGRLRIPGEAEEVAITGTLTGTHISAVIDVETPFGNPAIEADLDREDHMVGAITLGEFNIQLEATRTDKEAVEFKVTRRKKRGKEGRPLPPKIDEGLEPIRLLLKQQIPAVVDVDTPAAIESTIKLFVDEYKIRLVLLNAEGSDRLTERIAEAKLGVIVPTRTVWRQEHRFYSPSAELPRQGIAIAFQSDAEDGARGLPRQCLYAVQQGGDPETVLRSLTIDAARLLKLDDRVGSLQPGRDGDLVIFSGHPFEPGTRTLRVFVAGKEVE